MTNKSIREYINLIENLQREGVAEGSESGAKILYTGKDKGGTVTISYEPDYIPGHSEKYIIRFDGKVKSEMPTLKSAVYGLTHYQFDTFRPNLQPNPKTALEQGVAEGSEDLVQIEYWQQETMESGRWVKTKPIPRATAEKIVNSFERGEIVNVEQGVAEGFGLRGTGNPGMPTPYDQGRADAKKGRPYDNPYDQPGEEQEHRNYRKGYEQGKQQGVAEEQLEETSPEAIAKIDQITRR